MIDMHIAQGLALVLAGIGFVSFIIFKCFSFILEEKQKRFYLAISIVIAILIIFFSIGLGICVVDYVGGV